MALSQRFGLAGRTMAGWTLAGARVIHSTEMHRTIALNRPFGKQLGGMSTFGTG